MRPLVVLSSLATGGAEHVTVSFLVRLAERGVAVDACTLTSRFDGPLADRLRCGGVSRLDLRARRLVDPFALRRLCQLLVHEHIDIVHAHGQDASILAALACWYTQVPMVITRHVLAEPKATRRQRLRAGLALAAIARADAIVAVSTATVDALITFRPDIATSRVRVIPNGIELLRYRQRSDGDDWIRTRRQLGIDGSEPLLLLPAVLREGKGHRLLLRCLPGLVRDFPDIRVAFAGSGELEAALRTEAEQLVGDRVLFLGHRDDIPDLLLASDLVVLPSVAEALPTVLMEAAAAGRPVVATRVGGVPEVVDHGRSGLLVPPDDSQALLSAITQILTDPERASYLGERARQIAVERFGLERMVDQTLDLWAEVLHKGGR